MSAPNETNHVGDNITGDGDSACGPSTFNEELFLYCLMAPVAIVCLSLSWLKHRKVLLQRHCSGKFGIIYPVELLINPNPEHRWTYVAAFIATVFALVKIIDGFREVFHFLNHVPGAFVALLNIVCCFIYAFAYYPIFAAISSKHLFGHVLGLLYTLTMTVIFFIQYSPCSKASNSEIVMTLLMVLPPGFCLIFVTGNFALRIAARFTEALNFMVKPRNPRVSAIEYVQKMFKRPKQPAKDERQRHLRLLSICKSEIVDGWLQYPLSVLVAIALSLSVVYSTAVKFIEELIIGYDSTLYYFDITIDELKQRFSILNTTETDEQTYRVMIEIEFWYKTFAGSLFFATILSFLIMLVNMGFLLHNIRLHMSCMYRGDNSKLPGGEKPRKPVKTVVNACKYIGYQVGYTFGGFVIVTTILFVFSFVLIGVVAGSIRYGTFGKLLLSLFNVAWPYVVLFLLVYATQRLLVRKWFLMKNSQGKRVLAIDNRRLFFNFEYFMIFVNVGMGIVACLKRIFMSAAINTCLIGRLDMSSLTRQFERFDGAFSSYIGLLCVEMAHSHPVMLAFIELLWESQFKCTDLAEKRREKLRLKWWLLVNLSKIPSLQQYRRRGIQAESDNPPSLGWNLNRDLLQLRSHLL